MPAVSFSVPDASVSTSVSTRSATGCTSIVILVEFSATSVNESSLLYTTTSNVTLPLKFSGGITLILSKLKVVWPGGKEILHSPPLLFVAPSIVKPSGTPVSFIDRICSEPSTSTIVPPIPTSDTPPASS